VSLWKFCFDESYKGGHGLFVSAGVMATIEQWDAFHERWRVELARKPGIPYFHRSEAEQPGNPKSVFYGWPRQSILNKLEALEAVLSETLPWRTVAAFWQHEFKAVMQRTGVPRPYDDKYLFGYFASLEAAAVHMRSLEGPQKKPLLIFDRWTDTARETRALQIHAGLHACRPEHGDIYEIARWLPRSSTFVDDEDGDVGLQAADLVAWRYRHDLMEAIRTGSEFQIGPVHGDDAWLVTQSPAQIETWAKIMKGIAEAVQEALRARP
jgi:hypothetical protein